MAEQPNGRKAEYWRANNRLILALLAVWALVAFGGGIFFVEALNRIQFFGLPFGFWIAQQGAIYVFILLVVVYAVAMDRIDHKYHLDED